MDQPLTPPEVNELHRNADTDSSWKAIHHTLGTKQNEASPGNHTHDGKTSSLIKNRDTTDTGWISVADNFTSGIGVQYRIITTGVIGICFVRMDGFISTTHNVTRTIANSGSLPVEARPSVVCRTGASYGLAPGSASILTNGGIEGFQNSGSSQADGSAIWSYPVDGLVL